MVVEKQVLQRHINSDYLAVIDAEAERNNMSRSALLELVIETFAKNVQIADAAETLKSPLYDVTQQLNQLTHAQILVHFDNPICQLSYLIWCIDPAEYAEFLTPSFASLPSTSPFENWHRGANFSIKFKITEHKGKLPQHSLRPCSARVSSSSIFVNAVRL